MTLPGPPPPWEAWAPPLDPPEDGGLPRAEAEAIAAAFWCCDPHLAAALMWEAYAARLPLEPAVSSVQTGVQSVTYAPAYQGAAWAKAAWHRSLAGNLASLPLELAPPYIGPVPPERGPAWWAVEPDP